MHGEGGHSGARVVRCWQLLGATVWLTMSLRRLLSGLDIGRLGGLPFVSIRVSTGARDSTHGAFCTHLNFASYFSRMEEWVRCCVLSAPSSVRVSYFSWCVSLAASLFQPCLPTLLRSSNLDSTGATRPTTSCGCSSPSLSPSFSAAASSMPVRLNSYKAGRSLEGTPS